MHCGIAFDTVKGLLSITEEKLCDLRSTLLPLLDAGRILAHDLASVNGKILHFSVCVHWIRVASPCFTTLLPPNEKDYLKVDVILPVTFRLVIAWILETLEVFAPLGCPIWPDIASSLYGAFLRGDPEASRVLVITCDASVHGWGAVARTSVDPSERTVLVGHFDRKYMSVTSHWHSSGLDEVFQDLGAQVHREALAYLLAFDAACRLFALDNYVVILRGDCAPALQALKKGSSHSVTLQSIALSFAKLRSGLRIRPPLFLHVPGATMVEEGVDDLSRSSAIQVRQVESLPALRDMVSAHAAKLGWTISLDLFACSANTLVPRFFSQTGEPDAEGIDALVQPDWGSSTCPTCGARHRETVFAFPPRSLIRPTIRKAVKDRVRGFFVVPLSVLQPLWDRLMEASVWPNPSQYVTLRNPHQYIAGADVYGARRLALFAVDFALVDPFVGCINPCGQEVLHRPRLALRSELDVGDLASIEIQRWQVAGDLHAKSSSPSVARHGHT